MSAHNLTKALFDPDTLAGFSYKGTDKYPALDRAKLKAIKGACVTAGRTFYRCLQQLFTFSLNCYPYFVAYVRGKYPNCKEVELNGVISETCIQARRGRSANKE